jgi:hypothetical protein
MPIPVALSSATSEYNETCLARHSTSHLHMAFNELEQVETGGKDDTHVGIFLDNKSEVDMSVSFKQI